jgi:hypothetical protein
MKKFTLVFVLLCMTMVFKTVDAQLSEYTFGQAINSYTEITGGFLLGNESTDDELFVDPNSPNGGFMQTGPGFPIGFDFTFDDIVFDRLGIDANGWIGLGQSALSPSVHIVMSPGSWRPLPTIQNIVPPHLVSRIAGFADDLIAQQGASIRLETIGEAPNRICVVQWKNYRSFYDQGSSFDFQIRLHETSNQISLVYGEIIAGPNAPWVQVGLRGAPSNQNYNFFNRTTTGDWLNTQPGAAASNSCVVDPQNLPPVGLTFTFSPQQENSPPNCAVLNYPQPDEIYLLNYNPLQWSGGGNFPTGYKLYLGTDNPPSNIFDGLDLGNVTAFSPDAELDYATDYFWKIVPYNSYGDAAECPVWSFTTMDDPVYVTFPFVESFEVGNTNASEDIYLWTQQKEGNSEYFWEARSIFNVVGSEPRTGDFNVLLPSLGYTWMFRPFYFEQGVEYEIELWAREVGLINPPNSSIMVYCGDAPNIASMSQIIVYPVDIQKEYQRVAGTFTPGESGVKYIGIYGGGTRGIVMDDITIRHLSDCITPSDLFADQVGPLSARLNWTDYWANTWKVEYGPTGFSQGTGQLLEQVTENPFILTNLSQNTAYDFYVQAVCDEQVSDWAGPASFQTLCKPEYQCEFTFVLLDDYGDGWDGATMQLLVSGAVVHTLGENFTNGAEYTEYVSFCSGTGFEVFFNNGGEWPSEVGLKIIDPFGEVIFFNPELGNQVGNVIFQTTADCFPDCLKPTSLAVQNISPSGAELVWQPGADESLWNLEWGVNGFEQGAGNLVENIADHYFNLASLLQGTSYDFYVQAVCDEETQLMSDWSGPQTFITTCEAFSLPFAEDFEGETFPPHCWRFYDQDGVGAGWASSSNHNHTPGGVKSAMHNRFGIVDQDGWLVSPPIALDETDISVLSFWSFNAFIEDYSWRGRNSVLISGLSGNPDDGDFVEIWSADQVYDYWAPTQINLHQWSGQTVYIAFRYEGDGAAHQWYLDDVSVETTPSGSLSGFVTSAINQPLEGARISSGEFEAFADETGFYQINQLPVGFYDFICETEGYFSKTSNGVEIIAGENTTLDFALDFAQIAVNPQSLSETLQPGETSQQQLAISNPGGTGNLQWQAYFIYQDQGMAMNNNIDYPVLWDNMQANPIEFYMVSTEFTALEPEGRIIAADDFIVPFDQNWEIRYVYTEGFSSLQTTPDAFKVAVFANNAGQPGDLLFMDEIVPDNLNIQTQHLYLNEILVLSPGHYWLSVYGIFNGPTATDQARWAWRLNTESKHYHAKRNDFAGLLGNPGWVDTDTYPSLYFKIGGYANSWLSLSQYSGMTAPDQQQVIDVHFDAGYFTDGQHEAEIRFIHNGLDQHNTEVVVPVSLSVEITAAPQAPVAVSPEMDQTHVALQPVFEWINGAGTQETKVRIEQIAQPNNILIHETAYFTGVTFDLASVAKTLSPKEEYRWQVTCKNIIGETQGDWWHFESIGAGTLSGLVTGAFSGDPLQGVNVSISNDYQATTLTNGAYTIAGIPEGTYDVTATLDGYLPQIKSIEINHGNTAIVDFELTLALKPPYGMMAEFTGIFDVHLNWFAPETGSENWLYYHDGTFENAFGSNQSSQGLAQLFTPESYPCAVAKVRYFNDGFGNFEGQTEVYILSVDGNVILAGPYYVNNAPANDWVTVDIDPVIINQGNFMVATINTNPGGPFIGVDNSLYNGTLYFGSVGNFTELGELNYYYVGSHEALVIYGEDGEKVLTPSTQKPESINSIAPEARPLVVERMNPSLKIPKGDETLLGYNLYRDGYFVKFTTETYSDEINLLPGNYSYTVTAVYTEGESVQALPVEVSVLAPPVLLHAIQQGDAIQLEWESKFTGPDENKFDRYFILYRNGQKAGEFYGTDYTDEAIVAGEQYCYTVSEMVANEIETGLSNHLCVSVPEYGVLLADLFSYEEIHPGGVTETNQTLMLFNNGDAPISFEIETEYLADMKNNLKSSGFCTDGLYSTGCTFGDGINNWEFANVSVHIPCEGMPSWYQDFTHLQHQVMPGETYELKVMARDAFHYFSVWMDFNNDKILTPDELVLNNGYIPQAYLWYTYTITIPEDAPVGEFAMRVRSRSFDPVTGPCDNFFRGNTVDFMVSSGNRWLDATPKIATIAPGESQAINLNFNSELLEEGVYHANLNIKTDNPFDPDPALTISVELTVTGQITQDILLPAGWSGWSTFVDPSPENDFATVVAPVVDDLIISMHFHQVFYPALNINTIGALDNQHGYGIKMDAERTLTLSGTMANQTVSLMSGWNLMPVIAACLVDAHETLSLVSGLVIALEVAGNGMYYPPLEINTLNALNPGKAYWVKVDEDTEVTFPNCSKSATGSMAITPLRHLNTSPWNDPVYSAVSHSVVFDKAGLQALAPGDMIGAFTPSGFCAGLAPVTDKAVAMALFGNDITTPVKDGFADGERLSFRVFRQSDQSVHDLDVTFSPAGNDGLFAANGLSIITNATLEATGIGGVSAGSFAIYPNPSSGQFFVTNFSGDDDVTYEVMDSRGLVILRGRLSHDGIIDLTGQPKGLYFVRVSNHQQSVIEKLILQ